MNYSEENPDNSTAAADAHEAAENGEMKDASATGIVTDPATDTPATAAPKNDGIPHTSDEEDETAVEIGQICPAEGKSASAETPDFITRREAEELIEQAYLRGRNQAVRAQMIEDSMLNGDDGRRGGLADDIAEIFRTRPSVWDNRL